MTKLIGMFGQSNSRGRITSPQLVSAVGHQRWFLGATEWDAFTDPTCGQSGRNSVWPHVANAIDAAELEEVDWCNVAVGGTSIQAWQPGQTTYENSIASAQDALAASDASAFDAIFWVHGEADALAGTAENTYLEKLLNTFNSIKADLNSPNVKLLISMVGNVEEAEPEALQAIRRAQLRASQIEENIRYAGHFMDRVLSDGLHLTSDADAVAFGAHVSAAALAHVYATGTGRGPQMTEIRRASASSVIITFDETLSAGSLTTDLFRVDAAGELLTVTDATASGNNVTLTVSGETHRRPLRVTIGYGTTGGGATWPVSDVSGLCCVPIFDRPASQAFGIGGIM